MTRPLLSLLVFIALAAPARAHDLQYAVAGGQAVVVRLFYVDDSAFAFEAYEVYAAGETLPVQVGRTDSQGRIAFLPDRAGTWRIKAISEDGHGLDFTLETDAASDVVSTEKPAYERYGRIVVGVAIILGLFGFVSLYIRRKSS